MESNENTLSNRQLEVVRKNLISVFRFAVKALIDKACFSSIDDGCEEFINFSAAVEHVLQHRLRASKVWYLGDSRSHFWFYVKAACRRKDLRGCIINIDNIENIKSPVAKGRAFLRLALMEKRLSEYLSESLSQTNITRRYYLPGAIMLGEEATELCGVLLGLNSIDFGFCLKGENYDTVECPLAVSYTAFMKFKQSHESMHSDLEEMRELSCGSSLASEDGADHSQTPASDSWPDRYSALHKRYMGVLEQKSFLEEVTATQDKALQTAATAQREECRLQQEASAQKRQYEEVILELQTQVARMKTINETLQHQLSQMRSSQLPLSELETAGARQADAARFASAMAHKQDGDRHSLTSSCERGSTGKAGDTRSLTSAVSEISVETIGTAAGLAERSRETQGGDTHSMVPLTGSLADLQLDLDGGSSSSSTTMGVGMETSSTTISNPEQATPVISISTSAYTIAFTDGGEINGNSDDDNVHFRESSATAAGGQTSGQASTSIQATGQTFGQDSTQATAGQATTQDSGQVSTQASTQASGQDTRQPGASPVEEAEGDGMTRESTPPHIFSQPPPAAEGSAGSELRERQQATKDVFQQASDSGREMAEQDTSSTRDGGAEASQGSETTTTTRRDSGGATTGTEMEETLVKESASAKQDPADGQDRNLQDSILVLSRETQQEEDGAGEAGADGSPDRGSRSSSDPEDLGQSAGDSDGTTTDKDTSDPEILQQETTSDPEPEALPREEESSISAAQGTSESDVQREGGDVSAGARKTPTETDKAEQRVKDAGSPRSSPYADGGDIVDRREADRGDNLKGSLASVSLPSPGVGEHGEDAEQEREDADTREESGGVEGKDSATAGAMPGAAGEKDSAISNSDSGSSDSGAKDHWDMLSDANQDSN